MYFPDETVEEALQRAQDAVYDHPILTRAQEVVLAKRIESGDNFAKQELVRCNTKLAKHQAIIGARRCKHLEVSDLFAAAVEGLERAAEKFDWRKGFKFSTYAMGWIRCFIDREIANHDSTIRLPVHVDTRRKKMLALESAYRDEHHAEIPLAQLAAELDVTPEAIVMIRSASHVASLDYVVGEDGTTTLGDFIPAAGEDEDNAATDFEDERIADAMAALSEHEKRILTARFVHGRGLQEVARMRGRNVDRVYAAERGALAKLYAALDDPRAGEAAAAASEVAA